jgi:hypothetical protein
MFCEKVSEFRDPHALGFDLYFPNPQVSPYPLSRASDGTTQNPVIRMGAFPRETEGIESVPAQLAHFFSTIDESQDAPTFDELEHLTSSRMRPGRAYSRLHEALCNIESRRSLSRGFPFGSTE